MLHERSWIPNPCRDRARDEDREGMRNESLTRQARQGCQTKHEYSPLTDSHNPRE